jgi:hypothetical protein
MRLAGHIACMRKKITPYSLLVEKPEGKRPLGRPKHRWKASQERVSSMNLVTIWPVKVRIHNIQMDSVI